MREIILLCMMALFFAAGYQFMKKVDFFLDENTGNSDKISDRATLNIAFEYSEDIALLEDTVEDMIENNRMYNFNFFYGTFEEIKCNLGSGKVDIGILDYNKKEKDDPEFCSAEFKLCRKNIQFRQSGIQLKPLVSQDADRMMIWRKGDSVKAISILLNKLQPAASKII